MNKRADSGSQDLISLLIWLILLDHETVSSSLQRQPLWILKKITLSQVSANRVWGKLNLLGKIIWTCGIDSKFWSTDLIETDIWLQKLNSSLFRLKALAAGWESFKTLNTEVICEYFETGALIFSHPRSEEMNTSWQTAHWSFVVPKIYLYAAVLNNLDFSASQNQKEIIVNYHFEIWNRRMKQC